MLGKISIKIKMIMMVFIPAVIIFILLGNGSVKSYNKVNELDKIEEVTILATKISAMVHNTQKERGASAGFVGSKGSNFADTMASIRKDTNKTRKRWKLFIKALICQNILLLCKIR